MKILCIADHKDPLIYSQSLKQRHGDVKFILGAGDLDLEFYGFIVSVLNKPLHFIFGNHNLKHLRNYQKLSVADYTRVGIENHKPSFGSNYIDTKIIKQSGLLIAGLGGCLRYNNGENQYTNFQMYIRVWKMIPKLLWNKLRHGRYLDILLTHAAPRGIHDQEDRCHLGFKAFTWFMKKFSPKYLIHGHIHIYDRNKSRRTKYLNTTVINAYNHVIIDTEKENG